jgi:hypothetical protein
MHGICRPVVYMARSVLACTTLVRRILTLLIRAYLLLLVLALQAGVEVLRDSVLPSLTDASAQHSRPQDFPLGFETGGEPQGDNLPKPCRVLRA